MKQIETQHLKRYAAYLKLYLLQNYPEGYRLPVQKDRYLQFAQRAKKQRYTPAVQKPPSEVVIPEKPLSFQKNPHPNPPLKNTQPTNVVQQSKKTTPVQEKEQILQNLDSIRKVIEQCNCPLFSAPLADDQARAKRHQWMISTAKIFLLLPSPSDDERAFCTKMVQGINQQIANGIACMITDQTAAIFNGWEKIPLNPNAQCFIVTQKFLDNPLLSIKPSIVLQPIQTYDLDAKKQLWKKIQERIL